MSEVYWIASTANWENRGGPDAWLNLIGLKPAWIDERFWFTQLEDQRVQNHREHGRDWSVSWPTAHRLLQLIINDMLCGMNSLVLLTERQGNGTSLAVLATPEAVGRYNLMPVGRLQPIRAIHSGDPAANAAKSLLIDLAAKEVEPESVHLMVKSGSIPELAGILPSLKRLVVDTPDGLIGSVQVLLDALKNQTAKTGLYLDGSPQTATLLEVL